MATTRLITDWAEEAQTRLKGRTIVKCRYLSQEEVEQMDWTMSPVVLQLDDGTIIFPSRDDEGNGPGSLVGQDEESMFTLPVCRPENVQ